jgi:hypothetical protein
LVDSTTPDTGDAMTRHVTRDDFDEDHLDMRPLMRIGAWGACAVVALGAAVVAGRTEVGEQRAGAALAMLMTAPSELMTHPTNLLAARSSDADYEARRLAESVRTLTADRDRLATRVAALERNLNDLTGSITRDPPPRASSAAAPVSPPTSPPMPRPEAKADTAPPPAVAAVPAPAPQSPPALASVPDTRMPPPAPLDPPSVAPSPAVPMPRPGRLAVIQSYVSSTAPAVTAPATRVAEAPAGVTAKPAPPAATQEIAIDLAVATNVNALRVRWGTIRTAHAALLDGLRPLVSVRESSRPGFTEFHLVAGPVADADAATRLCAALTAARVPCQPAAFDGQRLDLR